MRAVLLNGPPGCGKDTIGQLVKISTDYDVRCMKFAQPIIDTMFWLFGVSCVDGKPKGEPCAQLAGRTRREVAISFSEDWIKPRFGKDWFGQYALSRLMEGSGLIYVFTDSGFLEEAKVLAQHLGSENVLQVKIQRPGYGFNGDSRSYWMHPHIPWIEFDNDCTRDELPNVVAHTLVPKILKHFE